MVQHSAARTTFLNQLVTQILAKQNAYILCVAINGVDGSGKTRLADELAPLLRQKSANVIRASIDGFHNPRNIRYVQGKTSPEGFYHDSFDSQAFQNLLLKPLRKGGDLLYKTATFDHVTDQKVDMKFQRAALPTILLVDGIFLFKDEFKNYFDLKIFLDVPFKISYARMAKRDGSSPDPQAAENRRYLEGQKLYMAECNPQQQADILVDYAKLEQPVIL